LHLRAQLAHFCLVLRLLLLERRLVPRFHLSGTLFAVGERRIFLLVVGVQPVTLVAQISQLRRGVAGPRRLD